MPDDGRLIAVFPGEMLAKGGDQFPDIAVSGIFQYVGMKEVGLITGVADDGAGGPKFHVADQRLMAGLRLVMEIVILVAHLYILAIHLDVEVDVLLKLFRDHQQMALKF